MCGQCFEVACRKIRRTVACGISSQESSCFASCCFLHIFAATEMGRRTSWAPIFSAQTGRSSVHASRWTWSLDGMASGVKVNSAYCCEHMLTQCYWPGILSNLPATNERLHFHADNAPSHVSASTREFIRLNEPNNEDLLAVPPSSPDLNMCERPSKTSSSLYDRRVELRADGLRQAYNLPLDEIRRSICSWPQRLLKCHMASGRHFEG